MKDEISVLPIKLCVGLTGEPTRTRTRTITIYIFGGEIEYSSGEGFW